MMGKTKGAGPRINREYPKAIPPLWCAPSHQLNRVIVQSCTEQAIVKYNWDSRQCWYYYVHII